MKPRIGQWALTLGLCAVLGDGRAQVLCQGEDCAATQMGEDTFIAGGDVRIDADLPGDAMLAGGTVTVRGVIAGDLAAAGGTVEVAGRVGEDLYAAGGDLDIDATVDGSARIAGGTIALSPRSRIAGGVSVGGGEIEIEGTIGGYLNGGGGDLYLNGRIGGDVDIGAGELRIGPDAQIDGRLRYRSHEEARIDPAAQIAGGIERLPVENGWGDAPEALRPVLGFAGTVWFIGAALLGVLLILAAPELTARGAAVARSEPGRATVVGLAFLVTVPVVIVLLMITVIGIPIGIVTILGYLVAVFLGWLFAVIAAGDAALARRGAVRTRTRVLAFLVAFLVIALITQVPFLGGLVQLAVLVIGTGAFAIVLYRFWRPGAPPPASAAPATAAGA